MNFPKRVPVLANPQEGNSTLSLSKAVHTSSTCPSFILSLQSMPRFTQQESRSAVRARIRLRPYILCKEFGPSAHRLFGHTRSGVPVFVKDGRLNREVSNGGAFDCARSDFEACPSGR